MIDSAIGCLADLAQPKVNPPLDPAFRPAALANKAFRVAVMESGAPVSLVIGLERTDGSRSRYETQVIPQGHPLDGLNLPYVERLVKMLLWQKGGWKLTIGGPTELGAHIAEIYSEGGARAFDWGIMGNTIFERPFEVIVTDAESVLPARESSVALGRHLDGCRIGFDLGASDRKVAAVIDGESVFSEEIVWDPRGNSDPQYHFDQIMDGLRSAAAHMPKVDAIGGSSAGVIINNRPMVASLFRGVPRDLFESKIKNLFLDVRNAWGVPLEVANDGDVTALAGAMSLDDTCILGVAMGSSEAVGYVNEQGNITGWLNELAFAPIDYALDAPVDEWSGDSGCGAQYLTQQAVFRLAPKVGIMLNESDSLADKLKSVQVLLQGGDERAVRIWETVGVYMGYAIAHYADFYPIRHMLILGRVTSGDGGTIILQKANEVLEAEFPELARAMTLHLPDEKTRRVGQAVAAASLPVIE
ncbi:MAG: ROK family protein [Armatimonadetes bacterium]|nr:ROK family protein [Armatimonadota bacterium]